MKAHKVSILILLFIGVFASYGQQIDLTLVHIKQSPVKYDTIINQKSGWINNKLIKYPIITPDQKSLIKLSGGFISYNYNYISSIDTPFMGTNISQHYILASLNLQVANIFPVRVNYLMRYSNSEYYKTINDVQVTFDGANYRSNVNNELKQKLLSAIPQLRDSLKELSYKLKLKEFTGLGNWLQHPQQLQKLIESQEIIQIPGIARNYNLPDSVSKARADSIVKVAEKFVAFYLSKKSEYDSAKGKVDSLKDIYYQSLSKIEKYKDLANSNLNSVKDLNVLKRALDSEHINSSFINKYKWLLGIKQVAVGKNIINYSELTAKNINSTGLNFEYNSWYYLAIAAGTIDYRFRDFIIKPLNKSPQYLFLGRFGIGNIQKNNVIVSVFKGQKQIYSQSGTDTRSSTNITGVSLETRWRLNKNGFMQAEIAQTQTPIYIYNANKAKKIIDFSDKTNKALSFILSYYLPKSQTRIDGMYKYTGANYQSFTSFQTNSSLQAWHLKLDQFFLNRSLKLSASLKTNEFTNPFIIQNYKTNTVFKSFNVTYHKRHYPTIGFAYTPVTQLTYLNTQLSESKFYSLTSNINYSYRLKECAAISSVIFSRFINTGADSGFFFYNSKNIIINQTFIAGKITQGYGVSFSNNNIHQLLVINGDVSLNIKNNDCIGVGVKLNNLSKLGTYWKAQLNVRKLGMLNFTYDHGYLPGNNYTLIRNDNLNIGFMKTF